MGIKLETFTDKEKKIPEEGKNRILTLDDFWFGMLRCRNDASINAKV